jgi:hypothetical protein
MPFNFGAFVGGLGKGVTKAIDRNKDEEWDLKKFQMEEDAVEKRASNASRRAKQEKIDELVSALSAQGFDTATINEYAGKGVGALNELYVNASTFTAAGLPAVSAIKAGLDPRVITNPDGTVSQQTVNSLISYAPKVKRTEYSTDSAYRISLFRDALEAETDEEFNVALATTEAFNAMIKENDKETGPQPFTASELNTAVNSSLGIARTRAGFTVTTDGAISNMNEGTTMMQNVAEFNAAADLETSFSQKLGVDSSLTNKINTIRSNAVGSMATEASEKAATYAASLANPAAVIAPDAFYVAQSVSEALSPKFTSSLNLGDTVQFSDTDPETGETIINLLIYSGQPNPNQGNAPYISVDYRG